MKVTEVLLRLSNYIKFHNIPGDILIGKHRIWPKLTPKSKRHLMRRIDSEIENMKLISRPFIQKEESELIDNQMEKIKSEQKEIEIREKKRASRREMQDKFFSEQFDILRFHKRWE